MFLYFRSQEKENNWKHWQLKVAMLHADSVGGMIFGKDYEASLSKAVDEMFGVDDDEIATPSARNKKNKQEIMEQKLRAMGIPIKEV